MKPNKRGCRYCEHLDKKDETCAAGYEPDDLGTCPQFRNGYIMRILKGHD
jgi:hypothetical protein